MGRGDQFHQAIRDLRLAEVAGNVQGDGETQVMYALVDGNNFYVSCERAFRPSLVGRPVVVLSNNDGCAIARSNEAKALGVYFSPSGTVFQAERGHDFSVIKDGISN